VASTFEVTIPEGLSLDVLVTQGAQELAAVRIGSVGMFYSAGGALLPEESADIGHGEYDGIGVVLIIGR
jgi:hypothetical protein